MAKASFVVEIIEFSEAFNSAFSNEIFFEFSAIKLNSFSNWKIPNKLIGDFNLCIKKTTFSKSFSVIDFSISLK